MNPLNLTQVLWLSGTKDEINAFYENHDVFKLGWNENVRDMLIKATNQSTLTNMEPFLKLGKDSKIQGAFALLQGKIIGLVVLPDTKA